MFPNGKVGEYTLLSQLGRGRYGACFLAQDSNGRKVVLKRFYPRRWKKNQGKNHFEAVILSQLQHPQIPQLLGVINGKEGYFFVLSYQPGITLEKLLFQQHKEFSPTEIDRIGGQLIDLILFLHQRNVVHRDISIANVLDDGEQISLIDFGLARFADNDRMRFDLDYSCLGNLLLFLLYSNYHGKNRGPWYEELPLKPEQQEYLMKLMGLKEPFQNIQEISEQFHRCFASE